MKMTVTRSRRMIVTAWIVWFGCGLICDSAVAETLDIIASSQSAVETRDGVTLTLGYQITSSTDVTAQLTAELTGPYGEVAKDTASEGAGCAVDVAAGTNWYYRDFLINLPPRAANGLYDIAWTVTSAAGTDSLQKTDALTILPPVPVRIPILMYHKIGPALYSQYWITTDTFRGQMAALSAYGYTPLTCRELMDIRAGLTSAPAKPIMLTFDGGYENFYTDAAPAMVGPGFRSVVFLLTGWMGGDNSWDGDNNPVINFLTWDEVTALHSSGLVDLESHTVTHPDLTRSSSSVVQQELLDSKHEIENRYGGTVDFFCYPYGSYNLTVENACRNAGYFAAFAAWGGVEATCADKWALRRVPIYWDSTLDYNPGSPGSFFFNQIGDPDVKAPSITVLGLQFLDPLTDAAIPGNQLKWGQSVKVIVTASNSGPVADVAVSLDLDDDTDPSNGAVYDSHTTDPAQDAVVTGWTGQRTFEWLWQVPIDAPTGQYSVRLNFKDRYYVLGFFRGSYNGFTVASDLVPIESVKAVEDGAWVTVKNAVVTAVFADCFYIEADSRACGMSVDRAESGLVPGVKVDVAGRLITNSAGERCLAAEIVETQQ